MNRPEPLPTETHKPVTGYLAQALRLFFDGFDYLGKLDFAIDEAPGQGFVFRTWLESFKANGCAAEVDRL